MIVHGGGGGEHHAAHSANTAGHRLARSSLCSHMCVARFCSARERLWHGHPAPPPPSSFSSSSFSSRCCSASHPSSYVASHCTATFPSSYGTMFTPSGSSSPPFPSPTRRRRLFSFPSTPPSRRRYQPHHRLCRQALQFRTSGVRPPHSSTLNCLNHQVRGADGSKIGHGDPRNPLSP